MKTYLTKFILCPVSWQPEVNRAQLSVKQSDIFGRTKDVMLNRSENSTPNNTTERIRLEKKKLSTVIQPRAKRFENYSGRRKQFQNLWSLASRVARQKSLYLFVVRVFRNGFDNFRNF